MSEAPSPRRGQDFILKGLPAPLAELLRQIPACPELAQEAAHNRLFPGPGAVDDGQLAEEWKGLVEPDLETHFLSQRLVVASDLTRMQEGPEGWSLNIPPDHVEAWMSALNQARLAIASAHNLGEEELARDELPGRNPTQDEAIRRVYFYGLILEMLVQVAEQQEFGSDQPAALEQDSPEEEDSEGEEEEGEFEAGGEEDDETEDDKQGGRGDDG